MATMRGVFVLCLIQSVEVSNALLKDTDWFSQGQETLRSILDRKNNENVAKNVILFLGDGMGVSTVTAARIYKGQLEGRTGEEGVLSFETFPHTGLSKTYNVDKQVADSAGTANAFLCGVKTEAGVVGLNQHVVRGNCTHKEGNEIPSIVQWSHDAGKATGVVTTARITHATPSAAYAHSPERDWESDKDVPQSDRHVCADIAMQLVRDNSYIKVLLGGGRRNFLPAESPDPEYDGVNGTRLDGRNLMEEWVTAQSAAGHSHAVVWNQSHFDDLDPDTTDYLLGLFEPSHMRYEVERDEDGAGEPSLAEMTEKAIRILSRQNGGYFLLVEGGRIDHGHHDGLAKKALHEVVAMDAAVEQALRMTDADDTLIVVTADHSHVFTIGGYPDRGRPILDSMWSLPLVLLLLSSALAQTDLKVMVMGDWGQELTSSSRPNQLRVARAMGKYFEANPEVEFIISTGDNFYCCGVTSPDSIRFQNTWRDVYLTDEFPVMKSKRWYISVGNHDHTDNDDELNQVAFGDTEDQWYFPWLWYNFETVRDDFSVEFVAFDSQALRHNKHDRPAQQAFLDSTMGASTADYLIAFGHHPAENAGYHGGSGTIRDRVVPYMLTHHADVLVVGHDHNLQHITRANEEEHLDHIDYVITGGGGRALYSLNNANHNNLIQRGFELDFFVENFGFVIMNFAADKMSVDYYGLVGQDDYELVYSFDRENRRRNILNEKNSAD